MFFTTCLPKYTGPYTVGSVEIEIRSPWPKTYAAIGTSIDTLLFRIFYPADIHDDAPNTVKSYPQPYWFTENGKEYLKNLLLFLGMSKRVAGVACNMPFVTRAKLPCLSNAPLLPPPGGQKWPLVVFSHGLGGTRNAYSQFCGSVASYGNVVIVPEHRDMSAAVSYVGDIDENGEYHGLKGEVNFRRVMGVSEDARQLRANQLAQRTREIISILRVIDETKPNLVARPENHHQKEGSGVNVEFDWSYVNTAKGQAYLAGHSFGAATMVSLTKGSFNDLAHIESNVKGSNQTGLEVDVEEPVDPESILERDEFTRPYPARGLILLDPWCIPIYQGMDVPLPYPAIAVLSDPFYKWVPNFKLVNQMMTDACSPKTEFGVSSKSTRPERQIYLASPSAHHSQSDFALLFPAITKYAYNKECTFESQKRVMELNVNAAIEFIQEVKDGKSDGKYLNARNGDVEGWTKLEIIEGLTNVNILED
ncbi:platelet-activating factor acetylhydrolase [Dipodascopsis uninucleata]